MIIENKFENPLLLHENTMPNRAYYIPSSSYMGPLVEDRERSDRFQLLSGSWLFRYYDSVRKLKSPFYEWNDRYSDMETAEKGLMEEHFEKVEVPGVWQNYGYDSHQYTNFRYPFPVDPPYVPVDNPCGTYIRYFEYKTDEDAPRVYLNFEGVDSCFYVWMNGSYVGYSQVSHSSSEFDVTEMIREGTNMLAVLVLKWCDGSYMEDQDKFRMSGIFRDVYLLKRPEAFLQDYFIHTLMGEEGEAEIRIDATFFGEDCDYEAALYAEGQDVSGTAICCRKLQDRTLLPLKDVHLWNPENPYLYTLVILSSHETITERVGIREITVRDNVVYLNGTKITFKGVNRHESDPVTGPVVSMEQMKRDLAMIRRHNFNAIRTSHYPDVPMFYQLCDQYGFMLIDEADNESHGPVAIYYKDRQDPPEIRWNEMISDNPVYTPATLDRVQRMVERDKNRPSVLIWSMGNECGYGCTIEESLRWTKESDDSRLTHYESAFHRNPRRKYDYSNLDLYSRMYPSLEDMEDYAQGAHSLMAGRPDKPFIMCEYVHAMGNGPGDIEDYYQLMERYDCMCGGFVWEWCDHAIYKGQSEDAKSMYYYGGDHGEKLHDGNFCMDGLVYPDRRPHTGLLEYRNVYRPARAHYNATEHTISLENKMLFTDLKDYISICYEYNLDGDPIDSNVLPDEAFPSILPGEKKVVLRNVLIDKPGKTYLKLRYYLKTDSELLKTGAFLGEDEILLSDAAEANCYARRKLDEIAEEQTSACPSLMFKVEEDDEHLSVFDGEYHYIYNERTGIFDSITKTGKKEEESLSGMLNREFLTEPMRFSIWRAPTDNDRNIREEWISAGYDRSYSRAYDTVYRIDEQNVEIRSTVGILADGIQRIMTLQIVWTVSHHGVIDVRIDARKNPDFLELPRFGLRLMLVPSFSVVTYYGIGPEESYVDKHQAASHGKYRQRVENMHEDYIRPQENGSHYDSDYVFLSEDHGPAEVNVYATESGPFSFNVSEYTEEELTRKAHNYELVPSGSTVLHIDYKQNGIGSNSCGPELQKKYRFDEEEFTFTFKMQFR